MSIRTANIIAAVCAVLAVVVIAAGEVFGEDAPQYIFTTVAQEKAPIEYAIAEAETPGNVVITLGRVDAVHMPPTGRVIEGHNIIQGMAVAGENNTISFEAKAFGQFTFFIASPSELPRECRVLMFGMEEAGPRIEMASPAYADWTIIEQKLDALLDSAPAYGPEPLPILNINTATRDELMQIDGVGEVTADRIIQFRPYAAIEDLAGLYRVTLETVAKWQEQFELTI